MMQRGMKRPRSEALQTGSSGSTTTTSSIVGNTNTNDSNVAAGVEASGTLMVESKGVGVEPAATTITDSGGSSSRFDALLVRGHKRKGSHHPHGPESLATEEGTQMSHVYQSWTSEQQDRFAAFRRCTFRKETVSKLVTFCLAKEQQQRRSLHYNACQLLLDSPSIMEKKKKFCHENYHPELTLQNFVAPNCASEIISVVSTIAKSYAQRLVAATRQLATQEYNYPTTHKLLPQFYLQAHRQRAQHGLDPGFFIFPSLLQQQQPHSSVPIHHPCHAAGTSSNHQSSYQRLYSIQLAAAREAEMEFDKLTSLPNEEEKEEEEQEAPSA